MQKASATAVDGAAAALRLLHRDDETGVAPAAPTGTVLDARRLSRVRWRCRRGMLENDLVLARFLAERGASLTEDDAAMLDRLLDLPDNELWDLIARRTEPADPALAPLLEVLRN
jgi:antitoxin CptB